MLPAPDEGPGPVGRELVIDVGPVAHGGHCVARSQGRVLFVRHALPGERVRVRVTEGGDGDRFWRADAVEVLQASPDRVEEPCPWAKPGLCGGCDWQHATPPAQRALKAAVVREQMARLAGLDVPVEVEVVDGPGVDAAAGLSWRTRVQYAVGQGGRAGLRAHRSSRVVAIDWCRIAHPRVREVAVPTAARWPGASGVEVVAAAAGEDRLVLLEPADRARRVRVPSLPAQASVGVHGAEGLQRVRGRTWTAEDVDLPGGRRTFRVTGSGFWQVHPGAARALVAAALEAAAPAPGERALDLYAGAGLFAAALAQAVGAGGRVAAVESDQRAVADARRNLRDLEQVRILPGRVDRVLAGSALAQELGGPGADVVVLDPPRTGAKREVVARVAALAPRAVAYVACDPAALARDTATFAEHGYVLDGLRAFDLFPQTHHVECVARLVPAG
ncbi:class I SAM-dependent RNA methyltransferase [Quadrisphaera sp. DSM 44207]|uniref:class I SAM-dependent RNA methyltransferase n=1 Tax=Quadrisphaera sp. DSM 44207 TaxID=1881057 RepID=UPI000B88AE05|nr:TRAM domain-containing protein [Quadrisphaera sp. DSM 44207]